ncbi:MAG: hypothetical protein R3F43_11745 [bacterium]
MDRGRRGEAAAAAVVFEDVHALPEAALAVVDEPGRRPGHGAVAVVCTARPRLLERAPRWVWRRHTRRPGPALASKRRGPARSCAAGGRPRCRA